MPISPKVGSFERYEDGEGFNTKVSRDNTSMSTWKREVLRDARLSVENIKERHIDKLTKDEVNVVFQAESLLFEMANYYDQLGTSPTIGQLIQDTQDKPRNGRMGRTRRQAAGDCCDRVVVHYKKKLEDLEGFENIYGLFTKSGQANGRIVYQSHCSVSQDNRDKEDRRFEIYFCPGSGWVLGSEGSAVKSAEIGCARFAKSDSANDQCVSSVSGSWEMLSQKKKQQGITEFYQANDGLIIKCATGVDRTKQLDDSDCDREFSEDALDLDEEDSPKPQAETPKCETETDDQCCDQLKGGFIFGLLYPGFFFGI